MLSIYSDSSFKDGRAVATVFDDVAKAFLISNFFNTADSVTAEVIAATMGLQRANTILSHGTITDVTVYTDCRPIALYLNGTLELRDFSFSESTRVAMNIHAKLRSEIINTFKVNVNCQFINKKDCEVMRVVDMISYRQILGKPLHYRQHITFGSYKTRPYSIVEKF